MLEPRRRLFRLPPGREEPATKIRLNSGCRTDLSPTLFRDQLSVLEPDLEDDTVGHPPGLNQTRSRPRLGPGNPQNGGNLGRSHAWLEPCKRVADAGIVEEREAQDAKDPDNKHQPDIAAKTRLAFPRRLGFHGFIDF